MRLIKIVTDVTDGDGTILSTLNGRGQFRLIKILSGFIILILLLTLLACGSIDVVGTGAAKSYEALLNKISNRVIYNESGRWTLVSPKSEKFEWSINFSSGINDIIVEYDAEPFIKAGLNTEKLPKDKYIYNKETGKIIMPYELGQADFKYNGEPTAKESFNKIIENYRQLIGYHAELDHYGIELGDGNMFEWAKDIEKNDKDIVFVLNPKPFIEAGVDPTKIEGWIFAKVSVENKEGKMIQVDKFLKPYDI